MTSKLFAPPRAAHTSAPSVDDVATLIREEYDEMPGQTLTCAQICRLFTIEPGTCDRAVRMLVDSGVLACGDNGSVMRRRNR